MKRIKLRKIMIAFLLILSIYNISYATQEEILASQSETLNIKGFVSEANKYTGEAFAEIDVKNLMKDAIKGKIDNKNLIGKVLNLFGKEARTNYKNSTEVL